MLAVIRGVQRSQKTKLFCAPFAGFEDRFRTSVTMHFIFDTLLTAFHHIFAAVKDTRALLEIPHVASALEAKTSSVELGCT